MDHNLIPTPAGDTAPGGLSRREVMRRGALLGGAVIAAQSLGAVSALAQTSPPPPPPPDGGGTLPSNFQIIVSYNGVTYGVKYDAGGWGRIGNGVACDFATPYQDPTDELLALLAGSVSVGTDSDGHIAYILNLPAGVTFVEGRPFDGTCQAYPGADDKCGAPAVQQPDGSYAFPACD